MDCSKSQEVGEPPTDELEYIDDICNDVINLYENDSRGTCKLPIANLQLDNTLQTTSMIQSMTSPVDNIPINIVDAAYTNAIEDNYVNDVVDIAGEIICHDEEISKDPVISAMQASQNLMNQIWKPNLNTIIEEKDYDIKIEHNVPIVKQTTHVSTKRMKGRVNREMKLLKQHHDRISHAITNNAIYQATIDIAQNDSGANRSVTPHKNLLVQYKDIAPYPISGVSKGDPAIHCTGLGYIPWKADTGEILLIKCYYCAAASGTIISPSDVNMQYKDIYDGWTMTTKLDSKWGQLKFNARDGINHLVFSSFTDNNLWFHQINQVTSEEYAKLGAQTKAIVNSLSNTAQYELWHHRLGHPSETIMSKVHDNCDGVPKLKKHPFYNCATCNHSKFRKKSIGKPKLSVQRKPPDKHQDTCQVGQNLHIDFGFVRGSDYSKVDSKGKLVTSIDGYRSYCLVIDRKSRHISIILTKTKEPPIDQLRGLLKKLRTKVKEGLCTITADLGGELSKSNSFRKLLMEPEVDYTLRATGAYSSAQNGLAEKPNQDLARMMRSLLYAAGMGSQYWSYALRHSVYLKNRLPHTSLEYKTPYEIMNHTKPDLSQLRVFGSKVYYMDKPRKKKLDKMDSIGRFMTYKGTEKIAYVIDDTTKKERITTHMSFDEAFMSTPVQSQPPMAIALQQSGFQPEKEEVCRLKLKLLSKEAKVPERATASAAGLDLHSIQNVTIPPGEQRIVPTGIAMEIPEGYHGQIMIRSSLAVKHQARVEAGTIDSDYRGQIFIVMSNNGKSGLTIQQHDRVAQMVITKDPNVVVTIAHELNETTRNDGKFGSTGRSAINSEPTTAAAATLQSDTSNPFNIDFSSDPFNDIQHITFTTRGRHPTQGMTLVNSDEWMNQVIITTCKSGTATAKIPNWIKRLKNSVLLKINGTEITSTDVATKILSSIPPKSEVTITVGTQEKLPMHDDNGIPIIYFDQLLAISEHLNHIKYNQTDKTINPSETKPSKPAIKLAKAITKLSIKGMMAALHGILPKNKVSTKRLTRRKLQQSGQWDKWKASEWKQLDQYWNQKMFGEPCVLPPNANVLFLLWAYSIKDDGTLKARMVCNGKPSNKNTVIFGYTFAKSLDHVGARIFWATAAAKNMIVQGADASNAFAEAQAPKIPLYVRVNEPYREWWTEKLGRKPIPRGYVLPVHRALQGHPEAPRAWAMLIDSILQQKLKLQPTTHEPCLYHGTYKGEEVLFMRQVDDFAVAAKQRSTAQAIIQEIDRYMQIDIKDLGQLHRYNGVDVIQTKDYIKINNPTYIKKIIQEHEWMLSESTPVKSPTPMTDDRQFMRELETTVAPSTEEEQRDLQIKMNFNYRQAIGELIYAMVTCRPDISFPLIKLSQYSSNPAEIHYQAVIQIFRYLHATIDDGIIYWRKEPNLSLPVGPMPQQHHDNHSTTDRNEADSHQHLHATVDSDWAGDTQHRKSVSGIILKIAGGAVLYKTKYQDTLALSTTEAEFAAASDAGKAILYVRSILEEINMPQDDATALFIDNNGALLMGNAQQPTRRTRHMDLKKFAILDWIKRDLLIMKRIHTSLNCSDAMTKQTGRQLFYRHFDYIMGRVKPTYLCQSKTSQISTLKQQKEKQISINDLNNEPLCTVFESMCSREQEGDIIPSTEWG